MVKVSILMNCYNGEKYLKEAIDSVIAQTYTDWELVFWDNQSTDASAKIVKSYNDPRIKYIYAPSHTLLGEARNLALQYCTNKYLAFLDTDDMWQMDKLEKQIELMNSNSDIALCYSGGTNIDENGRAMLTYIPKFRIDYMFGDLLGRYDIYMQSVLIRKKSLDSMVEPNFDSSLKFCPDFDLFLRMAACFKCISMSENLVKYRIVSNSLTSQTKEIHGVEMGYVLDKLESRYGEEVAKVKKQMVVARALQTCENLKYATSICDFKKAMQYLSGVFVLLYCFKFGHLYRFFRAIDVCGLKAKIKRILKK
jgi:glycosyltransferase involved in cell wall biosynthesis